MGKTRPPYPAEFREQMVELVRSSRTPAELAREFEVTAQTIANWLAPLVAERRGAWRRWVISAGATARSWQGCAGSCGKCRWSATSWQRLRSGS